MELLVPHRARLRVSIQSLLEDDYGIMVLRSAIGFEPTLWPKGLRQSYPRAWPARLINEALDVRLPGIAGSRARTLQSATGQGHLR